VEAVTAQGHRPSRQSFPWENVPGWLTSGIESVDKIDYSQETIFMIGDRKNIE
jgi:hypothetical protein